MKPEEVISDQSSVLSQGSGDPLADTHCLKCGYSLRGLSEDRCPECGTAFDRRQMSNSFLPVWPRLMVWYLGAYTASLVLAIAWQEMWDLWHAVQPPHVPGVSYSPRVPGVSYSDLNRDLATALGILLAPVAMLGLHRRRDWGRKVYIVLLVAQMAVWLPVFTGLGGFADTEKIVVSLGPSNWCWAWNDDLSALVRVMCPRAMILLLLCTGLRRRSLARRNTSASPALSLTEYHHRQDWPLVLVVLLVALGISHFINPVSELRYLLAMKNHYPRRLWIYLFGSLATGAVLPIFYGLCAVWIWRRPARTRAGLATLVWLTITVWLLDTLFCVLSLEDPLSWPHLRVNLQWPVVPQAMETLLPLGLYLFVVRYVDAEAVRLVARQRTSNESSVAGNAS